MPTLATNATAKRDYDVLEEFEAGLVLTGAEVKSAKLGHVNLKGSFVTFRGDELVVTNMHIGPYAPAGTGNTYDPTHPRKLLVHKKELSRLHGRHATERLTLVPLSVYTKGSLVKLGFALARGKKKFEKRDDIKKRTIEREIRRGTEE